MKLTIRELKCPFYRVSLLQPVRLIEVFCIKGIGILPENCQVSVLERCPSYGMSVLRRFHCIQMIKIRKKAYFEIQNFRVDKFSRIGYFQVFRVD